MPNPRVYVLDPYHPDAIETLKKASKIHVVYADDPTRHNWPEDADAIIVRSETVLGDEELSKARKLSLVIKQGVGVDNIDLDAAKKYGIKVYNTPALNSEAVAELSLALALCLGRRICEMDHRMRRGESIIRSKTLGRSSFQKTVGVVGMGNIGRETAKKWIAAMDATIIGYDPYMPEDAWNDIPHQRVKDLKELLRVADIVTLHVPLTLSTRGMIGAEQLKLMKSTSILINCARGGVVDEPALLEALRSKALFGVGLDAMNVEPPTVKAYSEFLEHDNIIMLPHVGGSTVENQSKSGIAVMNTLFAVLEGKEAPGRLV